MDMGTLLTIVLFILGSFGSLFWYLRNRLDTISDNHLDHVQKSLDSIENKIDSFIREHLTFHARK